MGEYKITMQEYVSLAWAFARLKLEYQANLLPSEFVHADMVLENIELLLERLQNYISIDENKEG